MLHITEYRMKEIGPIEALIYDSCLKMDAQDFQGYLALCDDSFDYKITAHSPEINKDMIWLNHDKEGMNVLFKTLPKHNNEKNPLSRHCTVYSIQEQGKDKVEVVSGLMVFKTYLDGGATELFAVGKYFDTVSLAGDEPRLLARNVRLDTRMLQIGYHVPF